MSSLVSIIIPCYNGERWLRWAIDSALEQTHAHIEVIVVDDGSRDGSVHVARSYSRDRVTVIEQANAGASAARNRGIQVAAGAFLQFLDADDLLSPDKIERQVDLLRGSPVGCVAVCGTVYFRDGDEPCSGRFASGYSSLNSDDPVQWLLDLWTPGRGWGMVPLHAWLIPRSVVEAAGPWDTRLTLDDDGEYFTRVVLASRGVRWEPVAQTFYRQFTSGRSLSSQRSARHLAGYLMSVESKAYHVLERAGVENLANARRVLARQYMNVAFHAYPRFPEVAARAESRARALGGYVGRYFTHSRAGSMVERLLGWKAAKRCSVALQTLRPA